MNTNGHEWRIGELNGLKTLNKLNELPLFVVLRSFAAKGCEPEEVGRWMKTANPAFDGSTPMQVIERGEIDRIWRMLYDVESGQPQDSDID